MIGDPGKDVGKPVLRINAVHFRCDDQAVHGGRPLATAIRAGEQPCLSSESHTTQRTLRTIIRQADTTIVAKDIDALMPWVYAARIKGSQ